MLASVGSDRAPARLPNRTSTPDSNGPHATTRAPAPAKVNAAKGRPESSGKTPRLIPLWEHPLGEVFGTGDGKRAVMLTMLDRSLGPQAEHLAACRARVAEITRLQTTAGAGDAWSRLTRVVDVRRAGDGRIVVTTPLFEALSLRDTLSTGRLSLARVIAISRQLCHALRPLHRAGLHHGALSSASVLLVTDKGRKDAVRVVDLGVDAVFTGPAECEGSSGEQPLTPEHADGALTTRSDIYRIGVLLHTMLTGRAPFVGDTAAAVLRAHVEHVPVRLTGVASVLAETVSRCLAKDPSERFDSLDALEVALCQAQADAAITTVWDDLPRPTGAPPPPEKATGLAPRLAPPPRTTSPASIRANEASTPFSPPPPANEPVLDAVDGSDPTSPEGPATLEPVVTGRPPPARVTNATTNEAETVQPEAAASNEATTEFRRVDRPAVASRPATAKPSRVPVYLGGAALGAVLLGWFALRGDGSPAEASAADDQPTALGSVAVADHDPPVSQPSRTGNDAHPMADDVEEPLIVEAGDEPLEQADDPAPLAAEAPPAIDATESDPAAPTPTAGEFVAEAKRARTQGKTNEAIALFRRALAADGKNLQALEGLGLIYFNQGEYKKAVAQLKRAVAIAPHNVEYRTLLGDAFFKLERYKDAREHYAKAAQRGHPPAKSRLEKVQKKLGG